MQTPESKLSEISSYKLFITTATAEGAIERDQYEPARRQLSDWGVSIIEAAEELKRRGAIGKGFPATKI